MTKRGRWPDTEVTPVHPGQECRPEPREGQKGLLPGTHRIGLGWGLGLGEKTKRDMGHSEGGRPPCGQSPGDSRSLVMGYPQITPLHKSLTAQHGPLAKLSSPGMFPLMISEDAQSSKCHLPVGQPPPSKPTRLSNATSSLDVEAKAWQTLGTACIILGNRLVPLNDVVALPAHRPRVNPKSS